VRVSELLRPSLVAAPAPWRSFDDTVRGLVRLVRPHQPLSLAQETHVAEAVLARETESSTAILEIGIGIPHARLPMLSRPWLALAVSAEGLYEAVPMVRIGIVALLLSPQSEVELHLQTLAAMSVLFRSRELRTSLLRAGDPGEALAIVANHELRSTR
jgi:nitrogen PTS system EIIA component